ncbi:MAG: UDP-N-acetylmuramate--L-alanine ligase [Bacteroidaceae bacterium]
MNIQKYTSVYFIGAGGIGMSALVRYFLSKDFFVAGYDRTATPLTEDLITEGAAIHFVEDSTRIPLQCQDKEKTLVIYTPAIPAKHQELIFFKEHGFKIHKRSEVLGLISRSSKALCVAGTHGKTTTSTILAHLMYQSEQKCTAFLGGIAKNYHSNLLLSNSSDYVVVEADEYDRSFHQLQPYMSVITSADTDHLDIYGTADAYRKAFEKYTSLIQPGGVLLLHTHVNITPCLQKGVRTFSYAREEGDYHAENIRIEQGEITIDFISPTENITNINIGVPISINIENSVAAIAVAQLCGVKAAEIRKAMATFKGIDRRFDFHLKNEKCVYLSDYAHHPKEIEQSIRSIRELYPTKKITGVFQPHLYTRTRDFYHEFAQALTALDDIIITNIYPAREEPIEGVSSELIYNELPADKEKTLCSTQQLLQLLASKKIEVLITLGAGDIENLSGEITNLLR